MSTRTSFDGMQSSWLGGESWTSNQTRSSSLSRGISVPAGAQTRSTKQQYTQLLRQLMLELPRQDRDPSLLDRSSKMRAPGKGPVPVQVERSLRRRHADYWRQIDEQVKHGRPIYGWQQCWGKKCYNRRCLYTDLHSLPVLTKRYSQMMDPGGRSVSFVNAIAQHFWGVNVDQSHRALLEAFLESPVIHGALGQFWKQCRDNKIELKATNFARSVAKLQHQITQIVLSTLSRTPVSLSHEFFGCEEYGSPRRWTLRQLVVQFVCTAETWRRYGLSRGFPWDFGSPNAVAEAYCGILVNFVDMVASKAFYLRILSDMQVNEVWQQWINAYSACRLQGQDSTPGSLAFGPSELAIDSGGGGRTEEVFTGYGCNATSDVTGGPLESFEDAELDAWTSSDDEDHEQEHCG
ncbi:uncharacterized protein F5Z01DRAFT_637247 [Emericellopsis atlantica]|uniref:Uncharacterized protein n=1 Tax=Emericellopsis atlantica TaxID=2614577 RepID=A0A9P8CQ89_9HYPO|nr:uncharacterized protein F5Z01DRAFT_637247 [Emericellopsis atlantica]KAG9253501.1 hypothetical protein F5Z01DRAFT_637247 [Emericellopsis atlantica]